jgi:hypothetical protein
VPEIVDAMKHRRGKSAGSFANVIEYHNTFNVNSATSRKNCFEIKRSCRMPGGAGRHVQILGKVTPSGDFGRVSAGGSAPPAVWCTAGTA